MDLIFVFLFILLVGMVAMTIFQIMKKNKKSKSIAPIMASLTPTPSTTKSTQKIERPKSKDYKRTIETVAKDLKEKKVVKRETVRRHILETKSALKHGKTDSLSYKSTVDLMKENVLDIFHVGADERPTKTAQIDAKLDQQMFWEQNQSKLMLLGAFASFVLLMIMAI